VANAGRPPAALFITARYRSGSTMVWNMFRQIPEVRAYYEPLHEKLPEMMRQQIPPQRSHPNVDDYFREYPPVHELTERYRPEFGLLRLHLEAEDEYPELETYLRYLLRVADKQIPVLQFNNVDFRLPWLRRNFPDIPILHLYRAPRAQWFSSIREFPHLTDRGPEPDPYSITTWSRDLCRQLPFLSGAYVENAYQRFYFLWKLSFLAGSRVAQCSVAYEGLLKEPCTETARLLDLVGLGTNHNVDLATAIMTGGPSDWRDPTHPDEWYEEQEHRCEEMLDDLGLNEHFGLSPLTEIVRLSSRYQMQMTDPRVREWQLWNGQLAVLSLERQTDEKELVIRQQAEFLSEKEVAIQELAAETAARDAALADRDAQLTMQAAEIEVTHEELATKESDLLAKEEDLQSSLRLLHSQDAELAVKESVIAYLMRFRRTSLRYWLVTVPHIAVLRLRGRAPSRAREEEIRQKVLQQVEAELPREVSLVVSMQPPDVEGNNLSLPRAAESMSQSPPGRQTAASRAVSKAPLLGSFQHHPPRELAAPEPHLPPEDLGTALPTISIVTPSFNYAHFLERTMLSVLDQGYPKLEYVIQDGGSTDETPAILDRYRSRLAWAESASDAGQGNAINLGFKHTSGEIMAYLNSDDLLLPGCLAYVGHFFALHPEVDAVYGHRIVIDDRDQEIGRWVLPPHDNDVLSWADYIPQETLFWRRSLWDKAGGYIDERFVLCLDWDLLLRFRDAGATFVRLPRFLGAFRHHPQQHTVILVDGVGLEERRQLRRRCLGRDPSPLAIYAHLLPYHLRTLGARLNPAWHQRPGLMA